MRASNLVLVWLPAELGTNAKWQLCIATECLLYCHCMPAKCFLIHCQAWLLCYIQVHLSLYKAVIVFTCVPHIYSFIRRSCDFVWYMCPKPVCKLATECHCSSLAHHSSHAFVPTRGQFIEGREHTHTHMPKVSVYYNIRLSTMYTLFILVSSNFLVITWVSFLQVFLAFLFYPSLPLFMPYCASFHQNNWCTSVLVKKSYCSAYFLSFVHCWIGTLICLHWL